MFEQKRRNSVLGLDDPSAGASDSRSASAIVERIIHDQTAREIARHLKGIEQQLMHLNQLLEQKLPPGSLVK